MEKQFNSELVKRYNHLVNNLIIIGNIVKLLETFFIKLLYFILHFHVIKIARNGVMIVIINNFLLGNELKSNQQPSSDFQNSNAVQRLDVNGSF